jgi:hypothetical protein
MMSDRRIWVAGAAPPAGVAGHPCSWRERGRSAAKSNPNLRHGERAGRARELTRTTACVRVIS